MIPDWSTKKGAAHKIFFCFWKNIHGLVNQGQYRDAPHTDTRVNFVSNICIWITMWTFALFSSQNLDFMLENSNILL